GKLYTSQIALAETGVAEDLTRYLLASEQIASAVLLGVLNRREGVAAAGGLVVQAFPYASEEAIATIEKRIQEAPPLSTVIEKMPIEDVVAQMFHGVGYKQIDSSFNVPVGYRCSCSRDRALAPLALFSPEELGEMIAEGGSEVTCQFCGRKYSFTQEELRTLAARHDV
ncbi:MAG TPA: Hsp33 family molecular chaperone HslO, partial [Thermoanaerobaculia bacterium]|nr:Hsp33 family molecular chaperone HslO [Thermoanaerobaculia bacterium]